MITLKSILVATDFSKASDAALVYGRNFARAFSAALHVVHVVDDLAVSTIPIGPVPAAAIHSGPRQTELNTKAHEQLDHAVTADDRRSLKANTVLLTSHAPGHALLSYAKDHAVDLVIVGTRGRGEVAQLFLGSVAQEIVRSASCPVLVVREREHEFVQPDTSDRSR